LGLLIGRQGMASRPTSQSRQACQGLRGGGGAPRQEGQLGLRLLGHTRLLIRAAQAAKEGA